MPKEGTIVLVFPGQGSQTVGMGQDLYDTFASVREIFQRADEVTGFALTKLIFEGPEEELRQTINAQPAIVTVSLACLIAIAEVYGNDSAIVPAFVAGHSLGEYTALAAAGVIDYETAIFLARQRGRIMHEVGQQNAGGMAAIMGLAEAVLSDICHQTGVVIANYNSPGQMVISGARENMASAMDMAKAKGALRVIPLQVSGAFHSPLMQPAVAEMSKIISRINFRPSVFPIIANVTAQPVITGEQIKYELLTQFCNGVQWQHSVEYMTGSGIKMFIEIGPGKVLAGLIKRINKDLTVLNVNDVSSANALPQIVPPS